MQKIYAQQDGVANAHSHTPKISSETGDQNTGIRSQRELEELRIALEKRIAYLEPKLREANQKYWHAAVVIARQENEILRLKAGLYDSLSAQLASEDPESY